MKEITHENVVVFLRDITQFVIGILEEENEKELVLSNTHVFNFGPGQDQRQVVVQFVPADMLSFNPPVRLSSLLEKEVERMKFQKDSIMVLPEDLSPKKEIIDQFVSQLSPEKASQIVTPTPEETKKVVKLFD